MAIVEGILIEEITEKVENQTQFNKAIDEHLFRPGLVERRLYTQGMGKKDVLARTAIVLCATSRDDFKGIKKFEHAAALLAADEDTRICVGAVRVTLLHNPQLG